jgi:hypothetical protein
MTRECGDCSYCCKLPMIAVLDKPADVWCTHCKPGFQGCTIYADRPQVCADFRCEWLREPDLPDVWRPTTSKMVLSVTAGSATRKILNIAVDPGTPKRWRERKYYARIKQMAVVGMTRGDVIVRVSSGARSWIILPDSDVEVPEGAGKFDIYKNEFGRWALKFNG